METSKRAWETEGEAVAFAVREGIELAASSSVDYIDLYYCNKEALVTSVERIPHVNSEMLTEITLND